MTVLYGGLFLASGAGLLAIMYLLVASGFQGTYTTNTADTSSSATPDTVPAPGNTAAESKQAQLDQLLVLSGIALAIMAVVALGLGWLMAGRMLRPLRTMAVTARRISEDNLHQRLDVGGPGDELKDLADTIDGLLARLEAAFEAQRRFVANASHELRTPLTVSRTMIEVALADPAATTDSLRETCREVLVAEQEQERLIEGLLTLARGQQGLDHREPVDLAAVAAGALFTRRAEAASRRLRIDTVLNPAPASGDPRLVERLVANLVDNAVRHNVPGGHVQVTTSTTAGHARLTVTNTGPAVPADQLERLVQPFQRLNRNRTTDVDGGHGLGLSIVAAIAKAHNATLTLHPLPGGGLTAEIAFAAVTQAPHRDWPVHAGHG
jgi:signal transduction histidine kinase